MSMLAMAMMSVVPTMAERERGGGGGEDGKRQADESATSLN